MNHAAILRAEADLEPCFEAPDVHAGLDSLEDSGAGGFDDGLAAEDRAARARPTRMPPDAAADDLLGLMRGVLTRDEAALGKLYDATSARVYGLALRITRRVAMAEEVVEETLWQAWRQAPRFDPERGAVLTWLLAIARSRAIDALRRDERFQHQELPDDGECQALHDDAPAAPDLLDAARGDRRVHDAVAALDPRSRQLVALAFFRGLTHEEIARQTTLPLGTVKSLIRRALLQLRRSLDDLAPAR